MTDYRKFDVENWTSRMLAGLLELAILYVLQHYPGDHYPDVIKDKLSGSYKPMKIPANDQSKVWKNIKTPTLYSTINRLEKHGLIKSDHEIVGSRLKKKLKITDEGREFLIQFRDVLNQALKAFKYDDDLVKGVK